MSNKIKILIVEDEQMLAEILSDTLSDRDFDVHLAYDGIQALEAVRKESPISAKLMVTTPLLNLP